MRDLSVCGPPSLDREEGSVPKDDHYISYVYFVFVNGQSTHNITLQRNDSLDNELKIRG